MRGPEFQPGALFSTVSRERRVPRDHPLRPTRGMVNEVLKALDDAFERPYAVDGRASIAPAKLLRAQLLLILRDKCDQTRIISAINDSTLGRYRFQ